MSVSTTEAEYIAALEAAKEAELCKVHTDANIADPLTKALPQPKHEAHMRAMGIRCLGI